MNQLLLDELYEQLKENFHNSDLVMLLSVFVESGLDFTKTTHGPIGEHKGFTDIVVSNKDIVFFFDDKNRLTQISNLRKR